MKVKNPVSQNIRIFPKINQKKDLQNIDLRKYSNILRDIYIYTIDRSKSIFQTFKKANIQILHWQTLLK